MSARAIKSLGGAALWPRLLLVLLLASAGAACRPAAVMRPYAAPSAAELLDVLARRHKAVTSMNARLRATSFLNGQRVRATVQALAERGGRLRLEAEVSLQGTVAVLATDGKTFEMLDVEKNVLRRGPACPANVAQVIAIPMTSADVAALLLGDVDLGLVAEASVAPAAAWSVEWDDRAGADVLVRARDGLRVGFVRAASGRVRIVGAERKGRAGAPGFRLKFDDFETVGGQDAPRTILYAEGGGSFDDGVQIDVKERTWGERFADAVFHVTAPEGVQTEDVGCPD